VSILFAGTPQNAAETLRELVASGTPISLVLTRPDAPIGRKGILTPSPVAVVADELGIAAIKSNAIGASELASFREHKIDFAIVVALGIMLKKDALEALPKGWFNLHYSLLPRWRGAAPVQHALITGDEETGLTIFRIDEGLDTGPVLAQLRTSISPDENAGELLVRLTHLGISLLAECIPKIASGIVSLVNQNDDGVTFAPKLFKAAGKIEFDSRAMPIANRVRGVSPEPGAWTLFRGESLKLLRVRVLSIAKEPGVVTVDAGRVLVGCETGSLELLEVQPAGKNRMSGADWYRGLKGDEFKLGEHVEF
jgi:methionyl-tRNA formyltransferase